MKQYRLRKDAMKYKKAELINHLINPTYQSQIITQCTGPLFKREQMKNVAYLCKID